MALKMLIQKLKTEEQNPCVTISLNTHRTHPNNAKDEILLKNVLKEAEERVTKEFDKREVKELLNKIETVQNEVDVNYNLDSLHLFLSNDTKEIVRTPLPLHKNTVHVSKSFAIRPLLKAYSRSESYLIMLLSQGGVKLYEAINDGIIREVKNEDFPFPENTSEVLSAERRSDSEYTDDLVREYFNKIDKALVNMYNDTGFNCVVVCTTDNYSRLTQVADKPTIYHGYVNIDYNNVAPHQIVQQTWELVKNLQEQNKTEAIEEIKEAVASGKVITDLQEIYQAAIDGRGDLLIVHQDFAQPVMMTSERTFELVEDPSTPGAIDDITSNIAWEVLSKKGRIIFTTQDEIKELGKVVLKTRY
ncbi:MAG: hypothetical protein ABIR81_09780 [Ginsengibacter sp.]